MTRVAKPFPVERIEAIETDIALLSELRNSRTRLLQLAAEINDISLADLRGPSRLTSISYKRWRLCYLLRRMNLSYGLIGHLVNKDHSSVLYGVRRVMATLESVRSGEALPERRMTAAISRPNFPHASYVYWNSTGAKWLVRIKQNKRRRYIGYYPDFSEAVAARDAALRSHVEAA